MAAIYKITELTKEYEGRQVLDIESLDIHDGEIFALVGPSGAGKSTFLRLLNFLEPPTSGKINFLGREFSNCIDMPLEIRRRVTTVFQRPMLLTGSVWENVTYGLRIRGRNNSNGETYTVLKQVGLTELAHQRANTLSAGESQRAALARAMIIRPEVLLLDEPTANLDPYNVSLIENIVKKINRKDMATVVLVTHNIYQARRLANRVCFILDGKLIEASDVDRFFHAPKDPRTAAFVRGEMVY
jgi:tungstate transport system ATP-binding protein